MNFVDPWGLRYVDVYIWEWHGLIPKTWPGNRVGHVMITEADSETVILSQFPASGIRGSNITYDYWGTVHREGTWFQKKYRVLVPDDKAFDDEACKQRKRKTWTIRPNSSSETHCSRAAYDALKAGGVPLSGQDDGQLLPGNFGTMLEDLKAHRRRGDAWSIQSLELNAARKK